MGGLDWAKIREQEAKKQADALKRTSEEKRKELQRKKTKTPPVESSPSDPID